MEPVRTEKDKTLPKAGTNPHFIGFSLRYSHRSVKGFWQALLPVKRFDFTLFLSKTPIHTTFFLLFSPYWQRGIWGYSVDIPP